MLTKHSIIAFFLGLLVVTSFNIGRDTLAQNNQTRVQVIGDMAQLPDLVPHLVTSLNTKRQPEVTVLAGDDLSQAGITFPFVLPFPEDATILGGVFRTYHENDGTSTQSNEIFFTTPLSADDLMDFYQSELGDDFAKRNTEITSGDFRFVQYCYNPVDGRSGILTFKSNRYNDLTRVSAMFDEMPPSEEKCQVSAG